MTTKPIDDILDTVTVQAATIAMQNTQIADLDHQIATLTAERDSAYAQLAAIRHHLKNIADVAGYPADGWARQALKL